MSNIIVLKKYAYSYLSKYNTSKKNLHRILQNKIKRMNLDKKDKYSLYTSISAILTNLENNVNHDQVYHQQILLDQKTDSLFVEFFLRYQDY